MWDYLTQVKEKLSKLEGVKTCKIGYEVNATLDDYPIIRLVPSSIEPVADHYSRRKMSLLIYFGLPLHESQVGLEEVNHQMLLMEQKIRDTVKVGNQFKPRYKKTLFDEDKLNEPFKIMAVLIEVEGDA